jgi:thiol-disulfide isomerase/thioredoxin
MNRRQMGIITGMSLAGLAAGLFTASWIYRDGSASEESVAALLANPWSKPDNTLVDTAAWQNRVLVVNFWASWCPPCVEEMPALSDLQDEFASKNVLFVGIGIDTPSNIRQFLETTLVSYPIVMGGLQGSKIGKALGNTQGALPYTVVINAKGKVTNTKLGKINEDELRKHIKAAL